MFFAEIAPFPAAVLSVRWPSVHNLGDFTTITKDSIHGQKIDLLIGGTPCQSFSVAGERTGLDDPRGNLSLEYVKLAKRLGARWIIWENVPGALWIEEGRAFASILAMWSGQKIDPPRKWENAGVVAPAEGGYGLAWRVLDASGVRADGYENAIAQGRRRLFVIGYLGDWKYPAEVLFEADSSGRDVEGTRTQTSPGDGQNHEALSGGAWALAGNKINRIPGTRPVQNSGRYERAFTLTTSFIQAVIYERNGVPVVRHLTPTEYERLMGFPDGHTAIEWHGLPASRCPDAYRYEACGNSMCVNVIRALGQRIDAVEKSLNK